MKFKKICFIIFLACQFFCVKSIAGELENKTKELAGLQSIIKKISVKINDLKANKNALIAELKKLDIQYGKSTFNFKKLKAQIITINRELKKNQHKIKEKQNQINAQKHSLERQIKAAYGMGRNDQLKLMLNLQNPALSARIMTYYDYFNKTKLEKIAKIDVDLKQLSELKEQQRHENALLEEKIKQSKREQSVLIKTRTDRKKLLKKIDQHFIAKKQQLNRFKADEKSLKTLLLRLQKAMDDFPLEEGVVKEFAKLKGKLPWPVKGKVIKKFGARRSDSRWDGVLIKARSEANIRSVARGRVVYADWLRGYGLLTIIEHGKGFMSLYAFSQSLYKSVGDWVEPGMVIALVGQSGGQAQAGLYFGIRKKGKPVNPEKWCRKMP